MGKIPEYDDGSAFAFTDIKSFITATFNNDINYIELQMEENYNFVKYLKSKMPSKYIRKGAKESDKHYGMKIRTIWIHKKYWRRVWKSFKYHFQKANLIKYGTNNVMTLDLIEKKVLSGDLYEEHERDNHKKKHKVYRDR